MKSRAQADLWPEMLAIRRATHVIKALILAGLFLLFDQASKRFVALRTDAQPIAYGRLLKIHPISNRQAMLHASAPRIILPVLWLIALVSVVLLYKSGIWFRSESALLGLGLAFSGAAGNLLDLLRRKCVLDFIDLGWWPVFNLADVGIVAGLVMAFWPCG
jgi:signal peptidase II